MPFDATATPRAVLATRRFLRERRDFAGKYPGFDAALRDFVRFRAAATNGEPYDAKDGPYRNNLRGVRRWHAWHGKAIVLYMLPPGEVRLCAVIEHGGMEGRLAQALIENMRDLGDADFAPAPLILADPAIEAACDALRDDADALRAALAEERAGRARAEADAAAALDLAHAEQARREAAEGEMERLRRRVAAGATASPPEPFGVWLRRARSERGLTQRALADMVGLSGPAIGRYEAGHEPGLPEFRAAIEAALGRV